MRFEKLSRLLLVVNEWYEHRDAVALLEFCI